LQQQIEESKRETEKAE
jgi:hypothetical protein